MPITKEEVEKIMRDESAAWNARDMTAFVGNNANAVGFGFRAAALREHSSISEKDMLALMDAFINQMEHYHIEIQDMYITVDGDFGFALATFIEDFQIKGKPREKYLVRSSTTCKKEDGGIKVIYYHRDVQPFDDAGNYIPRYSE
jgi:ketosteroid isomerase-like protein